MVGENGKEKRSIKVQVMAAMVAIFACMFVLLCAVFYNSMQSMLVERESESMVSQVKLAESVLTSSVDYLPSVTRDWSSWDYTYDYVLGEYDGFLEDYLTDYPFQLYRLNIMTVLDTDNNIVNEQFYEFREQEFMDDPPDLTGLYQKIGTMTQQSFREEEELDLVDTTQIGVAGLVSFEGEIYYLSSYPIIHSDESGPCVGSFMFGRIIDEDEMHFLTENSGLDFSVIATGQAGLSNEQKQELAAEDGLLVTGQDSARAYGTFTDLYGEDSLLVTMEGPRTLYEQGNRFITTMMIVMVACLAAALVVVIQLLNRIIVKPLGSFAREMEGINLKTAEELPSYGYKNREMDAMADAVSDMLVRIKNDRDVINKSNEKLFYSANFDELTGLQNRGSARQMLEDMIGGGAEGSPISVYFVDIDRFKYINDSLGRALGDQFIQAVAGRMKDEFGESAIVARAGGDEFMILVKGVEGASARQQFAARISGVFGRPFKIKERELLTSATVGSSMWPDDGKTADEVIANAEIAMYQAKEKGNGLYVFYQKELHSALQEKIALEDRLRRAINGGCGELQAYFQPKIDLATGEVKGCEALMRWNTPEGLVYPGSFIPTAEETGLIVPMTWWMLRECCRIGKGFEEAGYKQSIAINIAAQVLVHEDFLKELREAATETGMAITHIDIEITESTLLNDIEKVNEVLDALHKMDVEVSVDDFGTGYSSLSYLNRLAVDRIKIDRSFVMGIGKEKESKEIINAIMAMAKSLHMTVTAEGVEEKLQYEYLREVRCDEVQGYLISKPLQADAYLGFLEAWKDDKNRPF